VAGKADPLVTVRAMRETDLPGARRLQREEGWNQEEADWRLFLGNHPAGCFVAVDEEDSLLGTVTSLRYGSAVCWISMLLVDRGARGRGIGGSLMKRAIAANEGICRSLRLDATPAGRPVYERLGFRRDYTVERWVADPPLPFRTDSPKGTNPGVAIVGDALPGDIIALDAEAFGADRLFFLEHLRRRWPPGARRISAGEGGSGSTAFAFGRGGERYRHIGPVVARGDREAAAILDAVLDAAGEGPLAIDLFPERREFGAHLERRGFRSVRPFTRMTRGGSPGEDPSLLYAAAGPEFG
jgi:GNAT superfamily N-acetyltransferase